MFLGIDIGGTSVRVATASTLEDPSISKQIKVKNNHDFDSYMQKVIKFAKEQGKIKGVGVSITGDLNEEKTVAIDASPNAPEILNQPIVDLIKRELSCPVVMENDGTASALGEANARESQGEFIYIIWGTGIGGAEVIHKGGKIEVRQVDWFKHFENWENDCGGDIIKKKFSKKPEELNDQEWEEVMSKMKEHLVIFSGNFKTKKLVFGGGLALNQFCRLKTLQGGNIPKLELTKLGDNTGLYGAFALIKNAKV